MNIIEAIKDEKLFLSYFDGDLKSWRRWMSAIKCIYGLPLTKRDRKVIRKCTGKKKLRKLPPKGFLETILCIGRRSGKSRISALIAGFESVFGGHEKNLSPGEIGMIAIISTSRKQSKIVLSYLKAIFEIPLFKNEVVSENVDGFTLKNGIEISVLTGDYKSVRGYSLVLAIVDELAFFGYDSESKVRSDTELIRAIRPALATTGGKLIGITSPYIMRGFVWKSYKKYFKNDTAKVLFWNCSTRMMNPTFPKRIVEQAILDDPTAAASEYLGKFRQDLVLFCPRELIELAVIPGRVELNFDPSNNYSAFYDASGGRSDSSSLCIVHQEEGIAVVDLLRTWKAPHNPFTVCAEASQILKNWRLSSCTGDRYSAEFLTQAFLSNGINYSNSKRPKSDLYIECLPIILNGKCELLDNEKMIAQFGGLVRKGRSGGKDIVDHASGEHDDISNSVAGAIVNCILPGTGRIRIWGLGDERGSDIFEGGSNPVIHQHKIMT